MNVIALDGRKYFDYGIGTYIQNLVKQFSDERSPFDFLLYVAPEDKPDIHVPAGWRTRVVPYRKYSLEEIFSFGSTIRHERVAVFHSPHYTLPVGLKGKSVVTIHDMIHLRFPQYFNALQRMYAFGMIRHAVSNAGAIIVDSEFTKRDILHTFRLREDKITVIHLGVGKEFVPVKDASREKKFRNQFNLKHPYVLFVGNMKPHKGVGLLLRAFKTLSGRRDDLDLVFVGGSFDQDPSLRRQVDELGLRGNVRPLGNLSSADLVMAYNAAELLVLPSSYEGFGLPALEAMACGTPVVVSNAGSLPEVVGDAAAMFESGAEPELVDALRTVLRDSKTRRELVSKGKARARQFSWKSTAQKTLGVYSTVME